MSRSFPALTNRVSNKLTNTCASLHAKYKLRSCASVGSGVRVRGTVIALGDGEIHVGDGVEIDGSMAPIYLHVLRGGAIILGQDVCIRSGASIHALQRVEIGPCTTLGEFSVVRDNHGHSLANRHGDFPPSIPVTLGKACDIGRRAIVLPGASIGDGAQLHPGVVVSRQVPPRVAVVGSPPRIVPLEEAL